jgi:hypothetical protein
VPCCRCAIGTGIPALITTSSDMLHRRRGPAQSTAMSVASRTCASPCASRTEMHARFLAEQAAGAAESRRIVEASRGLIAEIQGLRDRVAKLKAARQDLKGAPTPPPAPSVGAVASAAVAEEPSADLLRLLEGRKAEIASLQVCFGRGDRRKCLAARAGAPAHS